MKKGRLMQYKKSQELFDRSSKCLAGGVSSNFRYTGYGESPVPVFYKHAKGSLLTDVDGNEYIDYALANGPIILGHSPQSVIDAVTDTFHMGQLYAGQTELEVELAEMICDIIPCAELVRFASSGSEADQAAMRLARAATGRQKIIKFEGHYHGWFDNIFISVAPTAEQYGGESAPNAVLQTLGQTESSIADIIVLPWNDADILKQAFEQHGSEIAGVVMEPILCNTGSIMPKSGYLETARELTKNNGSLLIFDEVITGFRVALSGAQSLTGVTPDLAVFAKAVAAGFTLAVLAGKREYMEILDSKKVMHGGTYNANTVAIAAGIATVRELMKDSGSPLKNAERRGQALIEGLRSLALEHGEEMLVQGMGTVFHPAFTNLSKIETYREFLNTDIERRTRFNSYLHSEGVRVTARGTWFLSTAHSDEDVEKSLAAAERAFHRLSE